jgi:NADH-quinone oxidoreductase subunit J
MNATFYISSAVAVIATVLALTRSNAIHGLLYLIVSLFAVAVTFFILGAPFVAALEVIVYAGAIMVLFVFAVMLLNLGPASAQQERRWMKPGVWLGPVILSALLLGELVYVYIQEPVPLGSNSVVGPKQVSMSLFGTYIVGIELASLMLLAGLVGAFYLGRRIENSTEDTN